MEHPAKEGHSNVEPDQDVDQPEMRDNICRAGQDRSGSIQQGGNSNRKEPENAQVKQIISSQGNHNLQ